MSQGSKYATSAKLSSGNRKRYIGTVKPVTSLGWDEEPKEKKMNFFKRWLVNIGKRAYEEENSLASNTVVSLDHSPRLEGNPLRMNVFRANGGTIVETMRYDEAKDRNMNQLHIVGHDQDLGESLSKIITMESLRG